MSIIAKRNFRKIDTNKKTPTFVITVLTDNNSKQESYHIECLNREILGINGTTGIREGVAFKIVHTLEEVKSYISIMSKLIKELR